MKFVTRFVFHVAEISKDVDVATTIILIAQPHAERYDLVLSSSVFFEGLLFVS
jgi:hypothetical protein